MKRFCLSIVLLFIGFSSSYCQESNQSDILDAGRRIVEQIIGKFSLSDSLSTCPYLGYWSGNRWIIVCERPSYYLSLYGCFDDDSLRCQRIIGENRDLRCLFSLTKEDFANTVLDYTNSSWYYHYFVLYDGSHQQYLECNSYMMKKKSKRKTRLKPVLPSSLGILWRIMMPELFE